MSGTGDRLQAMALDVLAVATGREHRPDPVEPGTGGPAGNASLTAWTGLLLLVLIAAEFVTLLDVRGLISWHVAIGTLLLPPALLKTATTTWRVLRYYTGDHGYRKAGPPPMLLRMLGPLVVVFTLAVLGTGLLLVLLGPDTSRSSIQLLGQRIDYVTVHQATFAAWAAVTGIHVLARVIPALRLTVVPSTARPPVPGVPWRGAALAATLVVAVLGAVLVVNASGDWHQGRFEGRFERGGDDGMPAPHALRP